jgi:GTP-binding protein Era
MEFSAMPEGYRSGYVGLLGRPNVGKSTLINHLLGQEIAPTSHLPQTTRRSQLGILTLPHAQIIFVDTPGLHVAHNMLGERMNAYAEASIDDSDVLLVIFDIHTRPREEDSRIVEIVLQYPQKPAVVALNKVDLLAPSEIDEAKETFRALLPDAETVVISAFDPDLRNLLLDRLIEKLPLSPPYFDEEQITDLTEREIATDLIRAAAMHFLQKEVPYSIAVRMDEYQERGEHGAYISATVFVERDSQKGIVIGKNASMLRQIGTMAREMIEAMSGRRIYLDLRVKVLKKWRNDQTALSRLGYPSPRYPQKK